MLFALCLALLNTSCSKEDSTAPVVTIDFESVNLTGKGYWNGSDGTGAFVSGNMEFPNTFNPSWLTWSGFSCSQKSDVTTAGYTNEFSVYDANNKQNKFALFYPPYDQMIEASFKDNQVYQLRSVEICNATYSALSMKNGDAFCKKFGGSSGTDADWFKVTITGYDLNGLITGSKEIYLADFRSANASADYILSKWTETDLSNLGKVHSISFTFDSSDKGTYGINTPCYVCIDNFKYELPN